MADLSITPSQVYNIHRGVNEAVAIAGATILAGQVIYLDTSDLFKAKLADVDALVSSRAVGIALSSASPGQPIRYQIKGRINIGATLTVGATYVASHTAGGIAPRNDLDLDDYVTLIGIATSASELSLDIQPVETVNDVSATTYLENLIATSPLALLSLSEASGTLADSSGNGYNCSAIGSPTYRNDQLSNGDYGLGAIAGGVSLYSALNAVWPYQSGSMAIWFKMSAATYTDGFDKTLVFAEDGTNGDDSSETRWIRIDAAGNLKYMHRLRNQVYEASYAMTPDNAAHLVIVDWDTSAGSGNVHLYLDDTLVDTEAIPTDSAETALAPNRSNLGVLDYVKPDTRYANGTLWYFGLYASVVNSSIRSTWANLF